jgi:hypothetical protein
MARLQAMQTEAAHSEKRIFPELLCVRMAKSLSLVAKIAALQTL